MVCKNFSDRRQHHTSADLGCLRCSPHRLGIHRVYVRRWPLLIHSGFDVFGERRCARCTRAACIHSRAMYS